MVIKQLSVYIENRRGSLCDFLTLLGNENLNILALSLADTTGFGIARCVLAESDIDKALTILKNAGYIAKVNHVICMRMPHKPHALAEILGTLEKSGVSLEYAYSFCQSTLNDAVVIIRPSDTALCENVLKQAGVICISQAEVDTF